MGFTGPCCRLLEAASVSVAPFPAVRSPTHSATFNKVSSHFPQRVLNINVNIQLSGSVGLVSRFGQFYKSVDPGLVQVNVCTESLRVVDVKIQISPIGRQKVITRDNVEVEM